MGRVMSRWGGPPLPSHQTSWVRNEVWGPKGSGGRGGRRQRYNRSLVYITPAGLTIGNVAAGGHGAWSILRGAPGGAGSAAAGHAAVGAVPLAQSAVAALFGQQAGRQWVRTSMPARRPSGSREFLTGQGEALSAFQTPKPVSSSLE
ncbi:hypothetical protein V8C86DRAFT_1831910 [Haematococcus lacustris]